MVDVAKLLSVPGIQSKGQIVDRVMAVASGVRNSDIFRRVIEQDGVIESLRIRPYGIEIYGTYPELEEYVRDIKTGKYMGRIGLLLTGENLDLNPENKFIATFRHFPNSEMDRYCPKPNLFRLLKDMLILPPIYTRRFNV